MNAQSDGWNVVPRQSRRSWLRLALVSLLPGAALTGCEPAQQALQPKPALKVIEERQTQFGRLAVVEVQRKRYLAYGPGSEIVYQSVLDLDRPLELAASYQRLMMLGVVYAEPHARMLQIGVGAGNMTGYALRSFPEAVVDAVDIDPHAVELGARHFGLAPHPRLRVHIQDGRAWLEASSAQFDVIMLDAYDDRSIPPALMDEGFFSTVAAHLAPDGVVMQNVYLPGVDTRRLLPALRSALPQVDVYRIGDSAVLAAYRGPSRTSESLRVRAQALDTALRPMHSLAGLLEFRAGPL